MRLRHAGDHAHGWQRNACYRIVDATERDRCLGSTNMTRDDVCFGSPHLHFQVLDRPSILLADGLPHVLDAFVRAGLTPPLAQTLRYFDTPEPVPITTDDAGPRRNALPMGRDVVTFPVRPWPQVRQDNHNRAASRE